MVTDFVTGMLNENDFRSSLTVKNKASNSQNSHQKKYIRLMYYHSLLWDFSSHLKNVATILKGFTIDDRRLFHLIISYGF